jgi:hypothetical protein
MGRVNERCQASYPYEGCSPRGALPGSLQVATPHKPCRASHSMVSMVVKQATMRPPFHRLKVLPVHSSSHALCACPPLRAQAPPFRDKRTAQLATPRGGRDAPWHDAPAFETCCATGRLPCAPHWTKGMEQGLNAQEGKKKVASLTEGWGDWARGNRGSGGRCAQQEKRTCGRPMRRNVAASQVRV